MSTAKASRLSMKVEPDFAATILEQYANRSDKDEFYKERYVGKLFQEKYTEAEKYRAKFFALQNEKLNEGAKSAQKPDAKKPNVFKWLFYAALGALAIVLSVNIFSNSKD